MGGDVVIRKEPLKFDDNHDLSNDNIIQLSPRLQRGIMKREDNTSFSTASSTVLSDDDSDSKSSSSGSRRIRFHDEVDIVPIPTRNEYPQRIKDDLWTNIDELEFNARRNRMEYASEGWDWRTVIDDESMFCYDTITRE